MFMSIQAGSEGYFSQSQEEEFGQSDECSAKHTPVFYNKPPGQSKAIFILYYGILV